MRRLYPAFFAAVVFSFSALMLIFSLLCSIRLSALNDSVRRTETELAKLQTENETLTADYESRIGLAELERYAIEVLGMQRCTAAQTEYIRLSEQMG